MYVVCVSHFYTLAIISFSVFFGSKILRNLILIQMAKQFFGRG